MHFLFYAVKANNRQKNSFQKLREKKEIRAQPSTSNKCKYQYCLGCPERPGKHPQAGRARGQGDRHRQPVRRHHRGGLWTGQDRVPPVPREH